MHCNELADPPRVSPSAAVSVLLSDGWRRADRTHLGSEVVGSSPKALELQ